MSRVGKKVINIPSGVSVSFAGHNLNVKGAKGELSWEIPQGITSEHIGDKIIFSRINEHKAIRSLHGLSRAQTWSMIQGVSSGFQKDLEIQGVGFRAELKGKNLLLSLGFSHPILFIPPPGVEFKVNTPTTLSIYGIDKQLVGEVASRVRGFRKPEPYKGKGVRYAGEYVRRKAGKSAGK